MDNIEDGLISPISDYIDDIDESIVSGDGNECTQQVTLIPYQIPPQFAYINQLENWLKNYIIVFEQKDNVIKTLKDDARAMAKKLRDERRTKKKKTTTIKLMRKEIMQLKGTLKRPRKNKKKKKMRRKLYRPLIFDCLWVILDFVKSTKVFFNFRCLNKRVFNVLENGYGHSHCNVTFCVETFGKVTLDRVTRNYVTNLKVGVDSWSNASKWIYTSDKTRLIEEVCKFTPNLKTVDVHVSCPVQFRLFGKKKGGGFTIIERVFHDDTNIEYHLLLEYLQKGNTYKTLNLKAPSAQCDYLFCHSNLINYVKQRPSLDKDKKDKKTPNIWILSGDKNYK